MTSEKNSQGARFEHFINSIGYNQSSFAREFGTYQTNISLFIKGERGIPSKLLLAIAKRYGQPVVEWITTGEGDLVLPKTSRDVLTDKTAEYRRTTPGEQLQILLDGHEKRIDDLETELRLLKDVEAEVIRLRGLVEGLLKGGAVKE